MIAAGRRDARSPTPQCAPVLTQNTARGGFEHVPQCGERTASDGPPPAARYHLGRCFEQWGGTGPQLLRRWLWGIVAA